jgi:hypothetical protein
MSEKDAKLECGNFRRCRGVSCFRNGDVGKVDDSENIDVVPGKGGKKVAAAGTGADAQKNPSGIECFMMEKKSKNGLVAYAHVTEWNNVVKVCPPRGGTGPSSPSPERVAAGPEGNTKAMGTSNGVTPNTNANANGNSVNGNSNTNSNTNSGVNVDSNGNAIANEANVPAEAIFLVNRERSYQQSGEARYAVIYSVYG